MDYHNGTSFTPNMLTGLLKSNTGGFKFNWPYKIFSHSLFWEICMWRVPIQCGGDDQGTPE